MGREEKEMLTPCHVVIQSVNQLAKILQMQVSSSLHQKSKWESNVISVTLTAVLLFPDSSLDLVNRSRLGCFGLTGSLNNHSLQLW